MVINNTPAVAIGVDCVPNDPQNISTGGPEYLGFDFYVRPQDEMTAMAFIQNTLKAYNIPLVNIYVKQMILIHDSEIWTPAMIEQVIAKEAINLQKTQNMPRN